MTTTLLIVRHGETPWNRKKIFRGTFDIPLNHNGRDQARLAATALSDRTIDAAGHRVPTGELGRSCRLATAGVGME